MLENLDTIYNDISFNCDCCDECGSCEICDPHTSTKPLQERITCNDDENTIEEEQNQYEYEYTPNEMDLLEYLPIDRYNQLLGIEYYINNARLSYDPVFQPLYEYLATQPLPSVYDQFLKQKNNFSFIGGRDM